jgi:hypothetical protein
MFAIRQRVEATGILLDPNAAGNTAQYFAELLRPRALEEVVRQLAIRLELPDLSQMTMDQIADCRRVMPGFRDEVMGQVAKLETPLADSGSVIDSVVNTIVNRYGEYMAEMESQRRRRSFLPSWREVAWQAAALHIPVLHSPENLRFFGFGDGEHSRVPPELLLLQRIGLQGPHSGADA